jgi:two-component system chemotaxis sensor kinase CheA
MSKKPAGTAQAFGLDDAASLLVQLDAADAIAYLRALDKLAKAAESATEDRLKAALGEAVRALEEGLGAGSAEAAAAIDIAGGAIEAAMMEGEGPARREDAPPAAKPAEAAPDEATPAAAVAVEAPAKPVAAPAAPVAAAPPVAEPETTGDILPADTDLDLLGEFIAETRDCLEGAEAALLALEADPTDAESVNTVFRAFHTVKGTSAFIGLTAVTEFAHCAESLLSGVREGSIAFTKSCADLALRSSDMLKSLIDVISAATPGSPLRRPGNYRELMGALTRAANGELAEADRPAAAAPAASASPAPSVVAVAASAEPRAEPERAAAAPAAAPAAAQAAEESGPRGVRSTQGDASVRVRTDRLDRLIDMVGELVIAQAMIGQDETVLKGGRQDFTRKVSHAGKIVRELQDLSMSMRMVPLKATFQKMVRLTRDAAHRSSKQVDLQLHGEDTEIDRNMVDVIADPLVHMVRNAVDHGIETPATRVERGKPATGRLRLSAFHAGGNVVVELEDDGKGLDRERIVRKAIEKGLIESDKGLTDGDVHKLIFAPGFSTNEVVTDLSGRGVGMDVVRRNIESLQGRVDITSELGRGTKFTVRLPLTLAITDGMSVRVGAERYIIPIIHIQISFRPLKSALSTIAGRGEMVLLRDELMPMVRLHRLFGIPDANQDPTEGLLVVAGVGEKKCALLVDDLLGQQQVVAKPLGDGFVRTRGVAGGAILGDGRVGLILDVPELMTLAQETPSGDRRPDPHRPERRRRVRGASVADRR